jgi:hypothetical protein
MMKKLGSIVGAKPVDPFDAFSFYYSDFAFLSLEVRNAISLCKVPYAGEIVRPF